MLLKTRGCRFGRSSLVAIDFRDDAVQELTKIYERSQDLWIQQWRDEMAELPMFNRLVA